MQVDRSELLMVLESVQSGLTQKDILEQSSCFVFMDRMICTFNDEVACQRKSPLGKLEGAVHASPLLNILRRLPDKLITIEAKNDKFIVKGKRRTARIALQSDVALPIHHVEKPKKWTKLHEDFADAISIATKCTGKTETDFAATCVYISRKTIEACDGHHGCRYLIRTRLPKDKKGKVLPVLARGSSIKNIVSLGMTEFCVTDTWIHFRNGTGLILSCRKDSSDFKPVDDILNTKGSKLTLPKKLAEAAKRAAVFSEENSDDNEVRIRIQPGKMRIAGLGVSGEYTEFMNVKYKGDVLEFSVGPALLVELVERFNQCEIAEDRILVNTGKFLYACALGQPTENGESSNETR